MAVITQLSIPTAAVTPSTLYVDETFQLEVTVEEQTLDVTAVKRSGTAVSGQVQYIYTLRKVGD